MLFNKKKSEKTEADMSLKLINASTSEIAKEAKSATDFSYSEAFGNSNLLVIGDTDHRNAKIVGSLANSTEDMAAAGVKRLLIELPRDPEIISAIAELNGNGSTDGLSNILDKHSRNPLQLLRLLVEAHKNGIEVVPIDMPFSLQKNFEDKILAKERGIYMGEEIAKCSAGAEGKTVVFCGLNHLNPDQIPAVMASKSVSYKSAAIFTDDQSSSIFDSSLIKLGVCTYVEIQNRKNKDTLIELAGSYGINSILYLKWQPIGHQAAGSGESQNNYLKLESGALKDIRADFSDSVEPDSKLWKNSNFEKIVKTIEMFGDSLNEFQKFYLSISMYTYLNSTMRNGGGSIVDINYDSNDKAFKMRSVDTFHYKYSKDADYGASMRYREVTMGMLLSQYGLPKSLLGKESDFSEAVSRIKIEPKSKDAAYKLIFMAIASKSGYGTVSSDSEGIYLANANGEKIVEAKLEEIKMDKKISVALDAGREALEWSLAANDALHKTVIQDASLKRRTKRDVQEVLESDKMMKPTYFFLDGISRRVTEAYSKFEPLDDSGFRTLANDFIKAASDMEESVKRASALLPEGVYKAFDMNSMLISDKRYVSEYPGTTDVKMVLDSCAKVMEAKKSQMMELLENMHEGSDVDLLRK